MSETIWLMDSECCCRCGCTLDYWETEICSFCLENERYDEEQWLYDGQDEQDAAPTIGTPEEAQAVALSLTDEDVERIEREVERGEAS